MLDIRYINLAHRTDRRRLIELQMRIHRLDAQRIDALGPAEGARLFPDSPLSPTACALMSTWYTAVREVERNGARHDAEWLILLEDDAVLVPWFGHRTQRLLRGVPDDCLLVQLGLLSKYTWHSPRALWLNLVMAALFVLRGDWRTSARLRGGGDDPHLSTELLPGAQATAVRVAGIPILLTLLEPYEKLTDELFRDRAAAHPGHFLRSRRQLAIQAPLVASDLSWERSAVLADIAEELDLRVIDRSRWADALRHLDTSGTPGQDGWLILMDRGTLPMPRFVERIAEILDAVPDHCNLVQFGSGELPWHRHTAHRAEPAASDDTHRLYSTRVDASAFAVAVRVAAIDAVVGALGNDERSIDMLFRDRTDPTLGPVVRARRQLVIHLPWPVRRSTRLSGSPGRSEGWRLPDAG